MLREKSKAGDCGSIYTKPRISKRIRSQEAAQRGKPLCQFSASAEVQIRGNFDTWTKVSKTSQGRDLKFNYPLN